MASHCSRVVQQGVGVQGGGLSYGGGGVGGGNRNLFDCRGFFLNVANRDQIPSEEQNTGLAEARAAP